MFEFLWNLSSFIVALGILITAHEYGHFWVARRNKVKVERFSIGFGKPIWRTTDQQGTEFVIALIPLGGYVKMLDERVDDVAPEDKNKTFNSKSVYQRIAIIAAGPLANFLFAIVAFYFMFLIGVPSVKPILGEVKQASIAQQAGMSHHSEITAISGRTVRDWQEVNLALIENIGASSITIQARTDDSASVTTYVLKTADLKFTPETISPIESLGIIPFRPEVINEIAVVAKGSPADKAGILVGDIPLAVDGHQVNGNWHNFTNEIKKFPNQGVTVRVQRNGNEQDVTVTPSSVERDGKRIGYLGVASKTEAFPNEYRIEMSYGVAGSVKESLARTWQLVTLSFDMIGKLITGDVSVKNLSGPIAIAQGAGDHAGYGFVYFLGFLALISINLGIINILPIPVLDGGHLVYYVIELFTGKPVPEKIQELGFKFGTLALLGLMSIALFNDLSRL